MRAVFLHSFGLLSVTFSAAAADKDQLVVPSLQASGVDANTATVVTELVLEALLTRHGLHALGPSDLKDMLSNEQHKQLLGCEESKCMAELSGALGASKIVTGVVGKLGDAFVVTIKIADTSNAQVIGRASRRFAKIEQATEVIGPLVDELLGQKPRPGSKPKILEDNKHPEKKRSALPVAAFCGEKIDRYKAAALAPADAERLLDERRALLEDLLFTPSWTEFEQKQACLLGKNPELASTLESKALAAATSQAFDAASVARADWSELCESLPILAESYRQGLDMERRATGARPTALPFSPRPGRGQPLPDEAAISAFHTAYDGAQSTVARLLKAAHQGDKPGFVGLFSETGPKNRARPRDQYVEVLKLLDAAALDPCPWFVLPPEQLKTRAAEHSRSGHVFGCLRRIAKKDGAVKLSQVELDLGPGKDWRILELKID